MAGTALDLSGINVSQAVEKMSNQVLDAARFDFQMKEKRRVEFMSDMELAELNQNLNFKNSQIALEKINEYKDKWAGVYAEKNGRITDRDRLDMLQDKQQVEGTIKRINGIQVAFEKAQQEITFGRNSDKYDKDIFESRAEAWVMEGKIPDNDSFLEIAPIDPILHYKSVRYPQKGESRTVRVYNEATKSYEESLETTWATDEEKIAQATHDFMVNDQLRKGVIRKFSELPVEEQQRRIDDAKESGANPYIVFNSELALDSLWKPIRGERNIQNAQTLSASGGGRTTKQPISPVYMDYHKAGVKEYYGVYDLSGLNFRNDRILVGEALNLQTGETETPKGALKVTDALLYSEKENKLVLIIEKKNYTSQRISNSGEPLFRVVDTSGSPSATRLTKDEADAVLKQKGQGFRVVPDTETLNTAFVEYEIDTAKYPATLEAIKRSGVVFGNQPKSQPEKSASGINWK